MSAKISDREQLISPRFLRTNGEVDSRDLLFLLGHIGDSVVAQTRRLDFDEDGKITQQEFLRYIRCQTAFKARGKAH
jgi:hypothetical protein